MKLLLDNCVWSKSKEDLAAAGHDVVHIGAWSEDPGDEEILDARIGYARLGATTPGNVAELDAALANFTGKKTRRARARPARHTAERRI